MISIDGSTVFNELLCDLEELFLVLLPGYLVIMMLLEQLVHHSDLLYDIEQFVLEFLGIH